MCFVRDWTFFNSLEQNVDQLFDLWSFLKKTLIVKAHIMNLGELV